MSKRREVFYGKRKSDLSGERITVADLVKNEDNLKINTWDKDLDWTLPAGDFVWLCSSHKEAVESLGKDLVGYGLLENKYKIYAWKHDGCMLIRHQKTTVVYQPRYIVTLKYKAVTVFKSYVHETAKTWRLNHWRSVPLVGSGNYYYGFVNTIHKSDTGVFVFSSLEDALAEAQVLLDTLEKQSKQAWVRKQVEIDKARIQISMVRKHGENKAIQKIVRDILN